ncbi:dTDP-4-amino-4,6-dideoxy-D-galactose acyltransferase [Paraglaciecola sp.]|uniref:dTDP-4-amino-4,6-dideoxy-D-galactose acyltransferase n=1 Tax=Paraglaciecola sp. TaxID=1920173 RepID=UPI0030F4A461
MVDDFSVSELTWDSAFFLKNMAHLNFVEGASGAASLSDFELVQAKVSTENYEQMSILNTLGFQLAEGEIDFSMWVMDKTSTDSSETSGAITLADFADIDKIKTIVENNFTMSRYRQPWFTAKERDSFYQLWAEKAIKGTFDDVCLIVKTGLIIKGFVTLKVVNSIARIGLISVAPNFKQQGVGKSLLQMAVNYCQIHNVRQLLVATQLANTTAIRLYSKFGFSINTLSYWFYKTHDPI